jgi:membrane-bound lytic murein transglycosylase A
MLTSLCRRVKSLNIQKCFLLASILLVACSTTNNSTQQQNSTQVPTGNVFSKYPAAQYWVSSWSNLPGWKNDRLEGVWVAWQRSCQSLEKNRDPRFHTVCDAAKKVNPDSTDAIQAYFENYFQVWELRQARDSRQFPRGSNQGLITSYYEPVLKGSLKKGGEFQTPLYRYPPNWLSATSKIRPARSELLKSGELIGLELVWVNDPVAAAFMQIQGSGRIELENKKIMRLGFAGTNNQAYSSIGQWLIQQKELTYAQASMQGISEWAKKHPSKTETMLNANPRFVFFKVLEISNDPQDGPVGSIGVPLTPGRSIAVDWQSIPKGAPVFLATTDPESNQPIEKLVFAQDTGSAIVGGVRADYYWGSGFEAGKKAGKMKQSGRMWVILPKGMTE